MEQKWGIHAEEEKIMNADDDWHPARPKGKAQVGIVCEWCSNGEGFVQIWAQGADDCRLELEFAGTREEAIAEYERMKREIYDALPEPLSKAHLKSLGFEHA